VEGVSPAVQFDLARISLRQVNAWLHRDLAAQSPPVRRVEILNPAGMHNLAVGLDAYVEVKGRG
jgi:hypothetical protein